MEEIRYIEQPEIRAYENENKELILEGYAATFGTRSKILYENERFFYEILEQGCFRNALNDGQIDVVCNRDHNSNYLLARTSNHTLELREDDKGLFFRAILNPNVSYSNDIYELVKRGDLNANSFAFWVRADGQEWSREGGETIRKIKEIRKLKDVSVVVNAAYPGTSLSARDYQMPEFEEKKEEEKREEEIIPEPINDEWRKLHLTLLKLKSN